MAHVRVDVEASGDVIGLAGEQIRSFIRSIVPSYESGLSSLRLRHAAAPVLRDLVQDVLPAAGVSAPLATLFKLGPEDIERSARHYYFPIVEVGEWAGQHSMWGTPVEAGADPHAELISASSLGRCFPRSLRLVPMDDSLPPCRSGAGCRSPSTSRGAANPFRAYLEHRWDADFHWGPLISERSMDPRRFGLRPGVHRPECGLRLYVAPATVARTGRGTEFVALLLMLIGLTPGAADHALWVLADALRTFATVCGEISEAKAADDVARKEVTDRQVLVYYAQLFHTLRRCSGLKTIVSHLDPLTGDRLKQLRTTFRSGAQASGATDDLLARIEKCRSAALDGYRVLDLLKDFHLPHCVGQECSAWDLVDTLRRLTESYASGSLDSPSVRLLFPAQRTVRRLQTAKGAFPVLHELLINAIDGARDPRLRRARVARLRLSVAGDHMLLAEVTNPAMPDSVGRAARALRRSPSEAASGLNTASGLLHQLWEAARWDQPDTPSVQVDSPSRRMCRVRVFIPGSEERHV